YSQKNNDDRRFSLVLW
ncbi:unnamed protein product, partial [Rotaria magnacalcarata]